MSTLLKISEIARTLRKSPAAIVRLIHSGELPAVKIGRTYRVASDDLEAYLERARVRPRAGESTDRLRVAIASHRHEAAERALAAAGL